MSARSQSGSKRTGPKKPIDRPFDPAILAEARRIVGEYKIILEFEDGEWYGHGLELPHAYGDGKTPTAAVKDTREAMAAGVACLLEDGRKVPTPAREGNRSVQINIRVTPEEKAVLEARARAKGYKGLSDYIRATVLADAVG